jgi:hypothetical protein
MTSYQQQTLRMLKATHERGDAWSVYLRLHARQWVMFAAGCGLFIYLLTPAHTSSFLLGVLPGLLVGLVARDIGYFRSRRAVWPVYERVIDWEKVEVLVQRPGEPRV